MVDGTVEHKQEYLGKLEELKRSEVAALREKWKEAGYFYSPVIVKTLERLEEAVRRETSGKAKILVFDRDMYPFATAKAVWGGEKSIEYDLIPASSTVFSMRPRNSIDMEVSRLSRSKDWSVDNTKTDETVRDCVDIAVDTREDEIIAFTRRILDVFGVKNGGLSKNRLKELLKGEVTSEEVLGRKKPQIDYVVLFDGHRVGTYVEMTREIIRRIFPDVQIRGVMLDTYNPRIACLSKARVGDFENIPKDYDLFPALPIERVLKHVRVDPRAEWASAFRFGLSVGIEELKEGTYEEISPPQIPDQYGEKQWPGDFAEQENKEGFIRLIRWKVVDQVELGDLKKMLIQWL